ncbi:MAG: DUF1320 family protein [Myxococcales bacterium]|nr:DUF1320 family protein [Myxococcales bacterium]
MAYATPADIETALGPDRYLIVADRDADGSVDAAAVTAAIAEAEGTVDSYLVRWSAELQALAQPLPAVKAAVVSIVVWKLLVRQERATEDVKDDYDEAMRWLRDVSSGKADLGLDPVDASAGASSQTRSTPRLMTRESMRGIG